MNANIFAQVPGGDKYDTVYPAGGNQDSHEGTINIVNRIYSTLKSDPAHCFILEGYSQGASATVNALPWITGAAFAAVKGVFLIGDPFHRPGLACNVDNLGGTSTTNSFGIISLFNGVPINWISKTLDVCIYGDGICDIAHGFGPNDAHSSYGTDPNTQALGTKWIIGQLGGIASQPPANGTSTPVARDIMPDYEGFFNTRCS